LNAKERGFLLLSSQLGNPQRKPLTTAQLRILADRTWRMEAPNQDRDLEPGDLMALGYGSAMAERILKLLSEEEPLAYYLRQGAQVGCVPITRVSEHYPIGMRRRLGLDSPGVLWAKGDVTILNRPAVALVGSRDIRSVNRRFAAEVGYQAARQGLVLVSGNARGSDREAQNACLKSGGYVISVVADELDKQQYNPHILYLSEDSFDLPFSAQRALSRNRVIHAMTDKVFVAQCALEAGGTWDGTVKNLRLGWSHVFCCQDDSEAVKQLEQMGASSIGIEMLCNLNKLESNTQSFFDQ